MSKTKPARSVVEQELKADTALRVTFLSPRVARIQLSRTGDFPDTGLNRYGFIAPPAGARVRVRTGKTAGKAFAASDQMRVSWSADGTVIAVADARGTVRTQQTAVTYHESGVAVRFKATADEDWTGFGDQTRERLFHRGHVADCHVRNVRSYIPVPFFMSTRGLGILVNTTHRVVFDLCSSDPNHVEWRDGRGIVDYYVMLGDSFRDLLDVYTELTGRPKLPPDWAFGLWYICRTQANDCEAVNDAINFRRENIPCDVIGLEPGWMEKNYDGSVDKDWSAQRFPIPSYCRTGPHNFFNAIRRMGYRMELWLCCDYDLSFEAERRVGQPDCGKGDPRVDAFFHKEAEQDAHFSHPMYSDRVTKRDQAWFEHLKKFTDQCADFFKQDGAYQVLDHPDRCWGNGMPDAEMHNLYPLLYARQMYEGFAAHTGRRPVVFTPAGWAGFQAWAGTWTGDTGGRLETLGAMLNTAMVAHSWATNDMEVAQKEGLHFGYLLPWSQINSWNYFRMPWVQGQELCDMHRDYAQLRARLIPYIYSWAWRATQTGYPLMVPLPLEFQADRRCRDVLHEYLLGRDLLVTIYKPEVYLPAGAWKDYWTGRVYDGGCDHTIAWPQNRGGGLFVREGAIIPFGPLMAYRGERPVDNVEWYVFPGARESAFEFYEDDGSSLEHARGRFAVTRVTAMAEKAGVRIAVGATRGTFAGQASNRTWSFRIALKAPPKQIRVNGTDLAAGQWQFDAERGELAVCAQAGPVELRISP
ncbi:MAG: hypothetical protein A3K19_13100 [Lentisphaerae bacterium RIFOXYB12_FULL_65_16]|nr:MAG: hypothetical protein A3K18_04605 [Lentisphaerae bacterium RIFOXYA12_64_32]OGV87247.1 MAG: hypothetical protein A3K19_13100 [Lentisphaerae bacterium RIFOXYB12_FULL_65_16]